MPDQSPILLWLRRDLRLCDHPALSAACATGRAVIVVFIRDDSVTGLGCAAKWRLGLGLAHLAQSLRAKGSRLILRSGPAEMVLQDLIAQTGAGKVVWSRLYDPGAIQRDSAIKSRLREKGVEVRSFGGHLLFEPWSVHTKAGGYYKVFTPFWNAVKDREVPAPLPEPQHIASPLTWPASEDLADWKMGAGMQHGAGVVRPFLCLGSRAALDKLDHFVHTGLSGYAHQRNFPEKTGTSGLSENLALGELSPHQCWQAVQQVQQNGGSEGSDFLKQLVWREFAYHLMYHTPHILDHNWKPAWDSFPWNEDETPEVQAWKQGRTGIKIVDAAMRELYVTGRMHNRGRMIVACYLTKHLLSHWRIGQKWFEECLIDWDPACNAMGWQWSAGSGPDSTPYFRVFNPEIQMGKFDPRQRYVNRFIAEGCSHPHEDALSYFKAVPRSWGLHADMAYPRAVQTTQAGRDRALAAYEKWKTAAD